jgi:AraC family transcriptional regulator
VRVALHFTQQEEATTPEERGVSVDGGLTRCTEFEAFAIANSLEGILNTEILNNDALRANGIAVVDFELDLNGGGKMPEIDQVLVAVLVGGTIHGSHKFNGSLHQDSIGPGGAVTLNPNTAADWDWRGPRRAKVVDIALRPALLAEAAEQAFGIGSNNIEIRDEVTQFDGELLSLARLLREEAASGYPAGSAYYDNLVHTLAVNLVRHHSNQTVFGTREPGKLSRAVLARVDEYIRAHLDEPIGLEDLSRIANVSKYHFSRTFKRSTGHSPHEYIIITRVTRAKQLLLEAKRERTTLSDIATRVGFYDQSHFTRHFRRLLGITPAQAWRQQSLDEPQGVFASDRGL